MQNFTFTAFGSTIEVEARDMPGAIEELMVEYPDDFRRFQIIEAGAYSGYGTVGKLMVDMRRLLVG